MNQTKVVVLVAMLMVAIGSWGLEHAGHGHDAWTTLMAPRHVFSFMGTVGSVVGAWVGRGLGGGKEAVA